MQKLSVVVPCNNEEANLRRFPEEVFGPLKSMAPEFEMVFVNDGSTDGTGAALTQLEKKFPFVRVAHHSSNQGLGAALRTGFSVATGDTLLTMDADLTFAPYEIPVMLAAYGPNVDCVMGSPFLGKMEKVHPVRHFLSWGVNRTYQLLLGRALSSVSSMFRLYRAPKIKSLGLTSNSFDINAEILFKLLAKGENVVEVPVTLGKRQFGESKINVIREIKNHLKMFARILRWKVGL